MQGLNSDIMLPLMALNSPLGDCASSATVTACVVLLCATVMATLQQDESCLVSCAAWQTHSCGHRASEAASPTPEPAPPLGPFHPACTHAPHIFPHQSYILGAAPRACGEVGRCGSSVRQDMPARTVSWQIKLDVAYMSTATSLGMYSNRQLITNKRNRLQLHIWIKAP